MYTEDYYLTEAHYEVAKSNGITRKRVQDRVNTNGWSIEDAITKPLKQQVCRKHWLDTALSNGIQKNTFYQRVNGLGWDEERAATEPISTRIDSINKAAQERRVVPLEAEEIAKRNGISVSTFSTRRRAGWSLEDAINTPVMTPKEAGRRAAEKRAQMVYSGRLVFGRPRKTKHQGVTI